MSAGLPDPAGCSIGAMDRRNGVNVREGSSQDGEAPPRPERFPSDRGPVAMTRMLDGHISPGFPDDPYCDHSNTYND